MPKVKPMTENERKDLLFREQLVGKMKVKKISCKEMSLLLNMSINSFYRKRDDPSQFHLSELRVIKNMFPDIQIL